MNKIDDIAPILPQSNYYGAQPDPNKCQYSRYSVKSLDYIEFSDDSDEPEELINLRRLPQTVLTEENLRKILNEETTRLNLEAHYWLKNSFLDKIGRMCPQLQELSLRRMKHITNLIFAEIFTYTHSLRIVDFSDCDGLLGSALQLMLGKNESLEELQLSGCVNAVDDTSIRMISALPKLTFLDISYTKRATDQGLVHFGGRKVPLTTLVLNAVNSISSAGMTVLLNACTSTLVHLEAAYLDQENMKSDFFLKLGYCFKLQYLDVSGCTKLDDNMITNLLKAELVQEEGQPPTHPGLKHLHTARLCNLPISDYSLTNLIKVAPNLEQLEIASCKPITDYGLTQVINNLKNLKFLDLSGLKAADYKFLEEVKDQKPDLLMRKLHITDWDIKKDCGLRVPLRVIKKPKKGKKKKGSKKK